MTPDLVLPESSLRSRLLGSRACTRARSREASQPNGRLLITVSSEPGARWHARYLLPGRPQEEWVALSLDTQPTRFATHTSLRGKVFENAFVLQSITVEPLLRERGVATDLAVRTHQAIAPDLPAQIQGGFTWEGWALAQRLHRDHDWSIDGSVHSALMPRLPRSRSDHNL